MIFFGGVSVLKYFTINFICLRQTYIYIVFVNVYKFIKCTQYMLTGVCT